MLILPTQKQFPFSLIKIGFQSTDQQGLTPYSFYISFLISYILQRLPNTFYFKYTSVRPILNLRKQMCKFLYSEL